MATPSGEDPSQAFSVCFVLDFSGNLSDEERAWLINDLAGAISPLTGSHTLDVIAFGGGEPRLAFPAGSRHADAATRAEAMSFLNSLDASGEADPTEALAAAGACGPMLTFLLAAGPLAAEPQVDRRHGFVNTILFANRDAATEAAMRRLAEETGGEFRFVGREEFEQN